MLQSFGALNLSLTAKPAEATLPHLAEKLAVTFFISARFAYFDHPAQICCVISFSVPLLGSFSLFSSDASIWCILVIPAQPWVLRSAQDET
jgi:hypothetical protein